LVGQQIIDKHMAVFAGHLEEAALGLIHEGGALVQGGVFRLRLAEGADDVKLGIGLEFSAGLAMNRLQRIGKRLGHRGIVSPDCVSLQAVALAVTRHGRFCLRRFVGLKLPKSLESVGEQTAMSDENSPEPISEGKASSKDITPTLRGWDYEPGTINVRQVTGLDGLPKLQMRLDLGLLQMEVTGRPDGARPHGFESLLDYYENLLGEHQSRHGTNRGFHLTNSQCQSLREEAVMYYQRYLSLFVLEDFPGVIRDTARNLRVLDLCGSYADDEQDRLILEQYRPYIVMMNARARASVHLRENQQAKALETVELGMELIRKFFQSMGREEGYAESNEVRVLKRLARDIRKRLPVNPLELLKRKLERAVKNENYEEAAKLRDKLAHFEQPGSAGDNATQVK
jgi:hypothetical protein